MMPRSPKRPCGHPGCPELTDKVYCAIHEARRKEWLEEQRESSTRRGYGRRWQKVRAAYLFTHPLCESCRSKGFVTKATVVDHIVPHRGDENLMYEESNLQGLCKYHHDQKTGKEDGRWG